MPPFAHISILTSYIPNIKQKKTYILLNSKGVYFLLTTVLFISIIGLRALCINHWTTQASHM